MSARGWTGQAEDALDADEDEDEDEAGDEDVGGLLVELPEPVVHKLHVHAAGRERFLFFLLLSSAQKRLKLEMTRDEPEIENPKKAGAIHTVQVD